MRLHLHLFFSLYIESRTLFMCKYVEKYAHPSLPEIQSSLIGKTNSGVMTQQRWGSYVYITSHTILHVFCYCIACSVLDLSPVGVTCHISKSHILHICAYMGSKT